MPDQILVSIAAAIASKAAGSLYDLVKRQFSRNSAAEAVLDAAEGAPSDSPAVRALADELDKVGRSDPGFADELRSAWAGLAMQQDVASGGVANQVHGGVEGTVVQARDVQGGVHIARDAGAD